jgi:DNA-binding response OmpR family regulator
MRLLLVEAETALACRVQESLQATGYTVDWARDGGAGPRERHGSTISDG